MRKQLLVVDSTTSHTMMSDETSQVLRACLRVIGPARLHQVHVVQYSLVQPLHLLPAAESPAGAAVLLTTTPGGCGV
jgi:hypothetical protein